MGKVRLSDGTITGKDAVGMGLYEAGIDEVITIVHYLCVCTSELLRFLSATNIGKDTVLYYRSLGKGPFLIHRNGRSARPD